MFPDPKTYRKLRPYLNKILMEENTGCPDVARELNMTNGKVLTYFSYYLKNVINGRRVKKMVQQKTCPTCGRLAHEVTDPKVCRDMIHFI